MLPKAHSLYIGSHYDFGAHSLNAFVCFCQDEKSLPKDFGPPDRAAAAAAALPRKYTRSFLHWDKKKRIKQIK